MLLLNKWFVALKGLSDAGREQVFSGELIVRSSTAR